MQSAYKRRSDLRAGSRNSSYEIQVTREVSVDSRPESRKKMQYTTFPPSTASQSRSIPHTHLTRESAESTQKPFADFSFSNSNDVDSIQNTLTGGSLRSRVSTLDLAQFLKTTSPPPSRGPSPIPHSRSNSTIKKFGLGLLRHHSSGSKSLRPPPPRDSGPMRLPESVVAKTAPNGKKYLLISVPTSLDSVIAEDLPVSNSPPVETPAAPKASDPAPAPPQVPQVPQVTSEEPLHQPTPRRGTVGTEGDSAESPLRPLSAGRDHLAPPVQPSPRSIHSSPVLDEELANTYASYLTNQPEPQTVQQATPVILPQEEEHLTVQQALKGAPKKESSSREPSPSNRTMNKSRNPSREALGRPTTAETISTQSSLAPGARKHRFSVSSLYSEAESVQAKHSRGVSMASDTPSHKSVSIHPHGVPSRSSSNHLTAPKPADTQTHSLSSRPTSGQTVNRLSVPTQAETQRLSHASTTGSVAESIGAVSDASSGVVMDAQVAQPVRSNSLAGYYSTGSTRKPPRPGPAPTRALPSLPESLDDPKGLRSRHSQGAMKPEMCAPVAVARESMAIVESPIVSNFFQPISRPLHDPLVQSKLVKAAIANAAASKEAGENTRETILRPGLKEKNISSPILTADALRVSRKSREERVRARKMRDMQSIRARHENKKLDATLGPQGPSSSDKESAMAIRSSQGSQMSNATDSSFGGSIARTSPTLSGNGRASPSHRLSANGSVPAPLRRMSRDFRRKQNGMSPVMLVMEQEPATGLYHTREHDLGPSLRRKKSSSTTTVRANSNPTPPRSPTPSIPSSIDDSLSRSDSKTTARTETPTTSVGARDSIQSLDKGKEAEIDARFVIMERKNAVLEAALLAVLQTSAGFGMSRSSSSQGRWSGQSASSTMSGQSPLEVLMQSMGSGST